MENERDCCSGSKLVCSAAACCACTLLQLPTAARRQSSSGPGSFAVVYLQLQDSVDCLVLSDAQDGLLNSQPTLSADMWEVLCAPKGHMDSRSQLIRAIFCN